MGRRPLCSCLILFLAVYLAVCFALPGRSKPSGWTEQMSGARLLASGRVAGLYEPVDGSQDGKIVYLKQVELFYQSDARQSGNLFSEAFTKEEFLKRQGRIGVVCYLRPEEKMPRMGEAVQIAGKARAFRRAANPGEFDAASYYQRQGYHLQLNSAQRQDMQLNGTSQALQFNSMQKDLQQTADVSAYGSSVKDYDRIGQALYRFSLRIARFYQQTLGEKNGGLAAAMVLGIRKGVDPKIKELYSLAGISHLIAISGLHISFVGMGLLQLLKRTRLPSAWAAALSCLFLFFYGRITGMSISTQRAVVMFFLTVAAQLLGRTADLATSLTVAAAFILLREPGCVQDGGFLLSFSAVAGVALFVPVLQEKQAAAQQRYHQENSRGRRFFRGLTEKLRQSLCASLGISLAMQPFLLASFYSWTPWSILANLLVIPLMGLLLGLLLLLAGLGLCLPGTLACGAAGGQVQNGILSEWLLVVLELFIRGVELPIQGIFTFYEQLCLFLQRLPGSCLHTGMPTVLQLIFYGGCLFLFWKKGRQLPAFGRMGAAFFMLWLFMLRLPGPFTVTMLDVGQGACVCLEAKAHEAWILDAGSTSQKQVGNYQIIPFLRYRGIRKITGICVSHWDEDHISGILELFDWARKEKVAIGGLYLPDAASTGEEQIKKQQELLLAATRQKIPVTYLSAGQRLQDGRLQLFCLHPVKKKAYDDPNALSMVLRAEYGGFSALFTGDLQEEGENWLVDRYDEELLGCQLLDAGHHGAKNATTDRLLEAASPQLVLISCGRENRYGHPAKETLARLEQRRIPFLVTAQRGALWVQIKKDKAKVKAFLPESQEY